MKRLNVHEFYELAKQLRPLGTIKADTPLKELFIDLWGAAAGLLAGLAFLPPLSKQAAGKVLRGINAVLPQKAEELGGIDFEKKIDWNEAYNIANPAREFETILAAELPTLTTYIVDQKGLYSTEDLVERAENMFSESAKKRIPDKALEDIRQGCRCIAFDLPTAAGFHLLRATESVILTYYQLVVASQPKKRDWGTYIDGLKDNGGDPATVAALDQIRALHRNPLMHPEDVLSIEESIILLGIVQSAILAMVTDMEKRQPPTASSVQP